MIPGSRKGHAMKDFSLIAAPEPSDRNLSVAGEAVSAMGMREEPRSRMEAGLATAMRIGIDPTHPFEIEERRYEMAFAHALARNDRDGVEAPALSSLDWARTLIVDASIQREAEITLRSPPAVAASRHRWGASEVASEPWAQAGVPPTLFLNATREDLMSMASGSMHEMRGETAAQFEISVIAAMTTGSPHLEHRLEKAAVLVSEVSSIRGRELIEMLDEQIFGPRHEGPDHADMGALADRMILARRAAEVGHRDARGLFDPTPGRNPFEVTPEALRRAERAVMGLEPGQFGRTVTLAGNSLAAIAGWDQDIEGGHRLKMAAARLLTTGPNPLGDQKADVRVLMADVYLQRAAEDRIVGKDSGAARLLETIVSGNAESRESVRFTTLASEREETRAVADGRFHDVGDSRGIASGLRNATWRAGIVGASEIDKVIRQEIVRMSAPSRPVSVAKGRRVEEAPAVALAIAARGGRGR